MTLPFHSVGLAGLVALLLVAGDLPPLTATIVAQGLDKPVSLSAPR